MEIRVSAHADHQHHCQSSSSENPKTKLETIVFPEPQEAPDLFPGHHAQGQLRASSLRRPAAKKEAEPCDDFGLSNVKGRGDMALGELQPSDVRVP